MSEWAPAPPAKSIKVLAEGPHHLRVQIEGHEVSARLVSVRLVRGMVPDIVLELLPAIVEATVGEGHIYAHVPGLRFHCPACGHEPLQAEIRTPPGESL